MHPAAQQAKLAAALKLITDEADPIQVRVKMAYVWGYIDALADAGLLRGSFAGEGEILR